MPFNDFGSVGTDVSIDLYDPQDETLVTITGITGFNAKPMTTDLESHALDGSDRFATIYRGWEISMDYDRMDGKIDAYFASREARQRSGGPMQTIAITETIREANGGLSQYRYTRVELKQDELGTFNREDKVTGRISGRGTRTKVL